LASSEQQAAFLRWRQEQTQKRAYWGNLTERFNEFAQRARTTGRPSTSEQWKIFYDECRQLSKEMTKSEMIGQWPLPDGVDSRAYWYIELRPGF